MFRLVITSELESMSSTAPSAPKIREDRTSARQWTAVGVLTLATFLVVTSEMLPVGVLTPMAAGLGVSTGAAGASLTITGLVSAVVAPLLPRVLGDLDRRKILALAMLVLAIGNGLTTVAGGYPALVISRIVLGLGMGTVWGLASAVATRLVATRNAALAVSFAVSGVASASVLGVPLGTFIGNIFGWRVAFGTLSALAVLIGIALLLFLPRLRRPASIAAHWMAGKPRSLLRPAVVAGLVLVGLLVTAHFAGYTYVRPILEERAGLTANQIALLLLLYGAFGLIGNFAAGAVAGSQPRQTVLLLAAGITVSLMILALFGANAWSAGLAIGLWGVAYGGLSVAAQLWMTAAAPDRVEHVTGLYVGVFNAAIALGAFAGGVVVEAIGLVPLLWACAALSAAALLGVLLSFRSRRPRLAP